MIKKPNEKVGQQPVNLLLFFAAILLMLVGNISLFAGTTYYVCNCASGADSNCIAGNDANSGTSPDKPWRSFDKAMQMFNLMNGGDQVLFADGGAWDSAQVEIFNTNASANNRITLSDYKPNWASGDEKHPLFRNDNDGILQFTNGGNASHDEGYVVRNIRLQGGGNGFAVFFYNDVDDVLLDSLEINNFGIGVYVAGGNTPNPGADMESQHIELKNSRITNCTGQGFLGAGSDLLIDGCYFAHNGSTSMLDHNVYIGAHTNISNVTIRNNELYQSDFINGKADGVSLVVHGSVTNILIEGNYIHEDTSAVTPNAWGIGVDAGGYNEPEGFNRVIIRGNKLINMYNTGIAVSNCPGAIIENNVIINEKAAGFIGIDAPDRLGQAKDSVMTDVNILNNSLYMPHVNSSSVGILLGGQGTGHILANNIISLDAGNCISLDLPDRAYSIVDYNLGQLLGSAYWSNYQTMSAWNTSTGFDAHSVTGDPLFVSPGFPDYNLALASASSPAVNAGDPVLNNSIDLTGQTRTGTPDIGAYEYRSTTNFTPVQRHDHITLFPVPVNYYLNFHADLQLKNSAIIKIYDIAGHEMLTKKLGPNENTINVSVLPDATYIITIQAGKEMFNEKFVVRH